MAKIVSFIILFLACCVMAATAGKNSCFKITNISGEKAKTTFLQQHGLIGPQGAPGARGAPGPKGPTGAPGKIPAECSGLLVELENKVAALEKAQILARSQPKVPECKNGKKIIDGIEFSCAKKGKKVWITFSHDSEKQIRAKDCEKPYCAVRKVKYNIAMKTIRNIVAKSTSCRQLLKFECRGVLNNYKGKTYWAWSGFDGKDHYNWGGATKPGYCACGMTGSCVKKHQKCNCDNNSSKKTVTDQGYLTNKAFLPVTAMKFGDMGSSSEKGWHTLGKLECY